MDQDVENEVSRCTDCQSNRKSPPTAPLHPWEWPEKPWTGLHVDYSETFLGKMFLVLIDSHSKWMDVNPVNMSTSYTTIEKFSVMRLPQMLVSDNATCFTSTEFTSFMKQNGIPHIMLAPFHPSSNRLAEHAVQATKDEEDTRGQH